MWYGTEKDIARGVLLGQVPQVGLAAKLLKDSGERELRAKVSSFTGKEGYEFGDLSRAAVSKLGETVATGVSSYTGKDEYVFGDLTKTTVAKIGEGAAKLGEGVAKLGEGVATGVTSAAKLGEGVAKLGEEMASGVSEGVSSFTGKRQYQFGDLTKAAVARLVNRILPSGEEDRAAERMSQAPRVKGHEVSGV